MVALARRLICALRPDYPFLAVVIGFIAIGQISHALFGVPDTPLLGLSWRVVVVWGCVYALLAGSAMLAYAFVTEKRSLLHGEIWRVVGRRFLGLDATVPAIMLIAVLPPFMTTFVSFKAAIPELNPYSWDVAFMKLDQALHFGQHPWQWLQPLLGRPAVTDVVDLLYYLWFPVLWISLIALVWHGRRFMRVRRQFLLSFVLSWIVLGVGLATLLSSAGPVYYAAVTGQPDPFAPLLSYLHAVGETRELTALWAQDMLWQSYAHPETARITEGISAMPSMHVAMATLLAVAAFRINRKLGWAYALFAFSILLGSVHLAWHYAVDGYLAIPATLAVWWVAGRILDMADATSDPAEVPGRTELAA